MGFELKVVRNNPLTGETDLDRALMEFLKQIGYLPETYEEEAGFHLVRDCFLPFPDKPWTVDELLTVLSTNRSTLYRYLNKLKGLDILDEIIIEGDPEDRSPGRKTKKGYKFRFSSLSLAWSLVESHTNVAMSGYRKSIDHIEKLSKEAREGKERAPRSPRLTVDGLIIRGSGSKKEVLLIKRRNEPYRNMWALPGGFLEYGETAEQAVLREVSEETGLDCGIEELLFVASDPGRDPRGHTVSLLYRLKAPDRADPHEGDDASEVAWFPLSSLPPLAFDHKQMIEAGKR